MGVEVGGGRGRKEGRERKVGCQEVERTGENGFEDFKAAFCGYTVDSLLPSKKTFSYHAHFSTRLFFFFFN